MFPDDYDWRYRDAHRDNGKRFVVRADENEDPNHSFTKEWRPSGIEFVK